MDAPRSRVLGATFCVGAFAVSAQVLFAREMLVAFRGNELVIGTVLAGWLGGIGLGALAYRLLPRRLGGIAARGWLACLLLVAAAALPLQLVTVRVARAVLRVPAGQLAPLGAILGSAGVLFLPTCFAVGLFFPIACLVLAGPDGAAEDRAAARAAALAYAVESLGSMVGGAVLTYALLPALTPLRIACLACAAGTAGAALALPRRVGRGLAWAAAAGLAAAAALWPAPLRRAEEAAERARWRALGVLSREAGGGRLRASRDTAYQNLAVVESEGQSVLYGNGQVLSVFPDPYGCEYAVHFIMAQKPAAKRVLLLGGNPLGDVPELLKYRLDRLVYVELDPGIGAILRQVAPAAYARAVDDPRLLCVAEDGPRFVRACRDRFDVVIVNGPAPATAAANRYYTVEFYRDLRRLLGPGGFLVTPVAAAERLQSEAADLAASVFKALRLVFPVVMATAESTPRFFAGGPDAALTFDRQTLYERSVSARVPATCFRPEYLLGADEIEGEKMRRTAERLLSSPAPPNTALRPAACLYSLLLWSRFSGSGLRGVLRGLAAVDALRASAACVAAGLAALLAGLALGARRRRAETEQRARSARCTGGKAVKQARSVCFSRGLDSVAPPECELLAETGTDTVGRPHPGRSEAPRREIARCGMAEIPRSARNDMAGDVGGSRWALVMVGAVMASTGFLGMAAEILLIMVFQGLCGYVYARIGLIVAVFMLGLAVGAPSGRAMASGPARNAWVALAVVEAFLAGVAGLTAAVAAGGGAPWQEGAVYLLVALAGWAVGAEFPLGTRLFCLWGGTPKAAAAMTAAADYLGAAAGALAAGVFLVPALGAGAACLVLAALKAFGLLCLLSGRFSSTGPEWRRRTCGTCPP